MSKLDAAMDAMCKIADQYKDVVFVTAQQPPPVNRGFRAYQLPESDLIFIDYVGLPCADEVK